MGRFSTSRSLPLPSCPLAGLPQQLLALQDASLPVSLPHPGALPASALDNWKLDKLVGQLGKDKATWRRAMLLFEWLKASRHSMDDRLCTTVSADQRAFRPRLAALPLAACMCCVVTAGVRLSDVHLAYLMKLAATETHTSLPRLPFAFPSRAADPRVLGPRRLRVRPGRV